MFQFDRAWHKQNTGSILDPKCKSSVCGICGLCVCVHVVLKCIQKTNLYGALSDVQNVATGMLGGNVYASNKSELFCVYRRVETCTCVLPNKNLYFLQLVCFQVLPNFCMCVCLRAGLHERAHNLPFMS